MKKVLIVLAAVMLVIAVIVVVEYIDECLCKDVWFPVRCYCTD